MKKILSTLAATLASTSLSMAVIELDIANVISQTGATTPFPPTNVAPVVNQFAQYELDLFDTDTLVSSTAYLQITLDSFSGSLTNHRISTGQNFPDRAGISIGGDTSWDATYTFSFFEDAGFTTALSLDSFSMQISDIDLVESVTVSQSDFSNVGLSASTELSRDNGSGNFAVTNVVGENIPKDNPDAAATFNSVSNLSSFTLTLAGSGDSPREFQFDFTPDLAVPEPSAFSLLIGLSALGMIATRRRSM